MLSARLTALAAVLIWISTLVPQTIIAQDAEGLPPGIRSVEVDGQPIDAATTPVTNNPTPEIGGRADLEVPAVELIIGDDGAIRVTAELDDRGRFRATVPEALGNGQYSLSINDLPIGSFIVDSAAQVAEDTSQPRDREPFLDIARVVPYPADFGDFAPGIGFLDGQYFTLQEEAARTAAADGEATAQDTREAQRSLGEAGWLQRYENRLAVPSTDNPETFDVQVSSFVVEYATGDHANAAFVELTGADSGVDFPVVGDESALTRLSGVTPDTGSEYQAARLVFRVGPMLGMIVYADLLNQEPDLALLETVAQTVAGRAAVVADRETVPLGSMALRLDPSTAVDALVRRDIYDVRAGTLTALYAEDDATREGRIELLTGTTDAFSSTTNGTFATGSANRSDRAPRATPRAGLRRRLRRHRSSRSKASQRNQSLSRRPRRSRQQATAKQMSRKASRSSPPAHSMRFPENPRLAHGLPATRSGWRPVPRQATGPSSKCQMGLRWETNRSRSRRAGPLAPASRPRTDSAFTLASEPSSRPSKSAAPVTFL